MVSISCGEAEPLPPFRPILPLDGWQPYIPPSPNVFICFTQDKSKNLAKLWDGWMATMYSHSSPTFATKCFYLLQPRKRKQLSKILDSILALVVEVYHIHIQFLSS